MKFDPPANVKDLSEKQRDAWNVVVSSWMDAEAKGAAEKGQGLFFNPQKDSTPGSMAKKTIPWDAFPLSIREWYRGDTDADEKRWLAAETLKPDGKYRLVVDDQLGDSINIYRRQQDEYCEWFAEKNSDNKITRVTFTAEGPEYWEFIASGTKAFFNENDARYNLIKGDPDQLVQLYRELLGHNRIVETDLYWQTDVAVLNEEDGKWHIAFRKGEYNGLNKWNTTDGVVHLTHGANTLRAEVNLAAQATILRKNKDGSPVTKSTDLVCCSGYGGVMRSSDPTIGSSVNSLAKQGLSVTLANPVGLYMGEFLAGVVGKNSEDMIDAWKVVRGEENERMILRAVFQVPSELGFTVSDCSVNDKNIRFGGQLADQIKMNLTGAAKKLKDGPFEPLTCKSHCCSHPTKTTVREIFALNLKCENVSSENFEGPYLPGPMSFAAVQTPSAEAVLIQKKRVLLATRGG